MGHQKSWEHKLQFSWAHFVLLTAKNEVGNARQSIQCRRSQVLQSFATVFFQSGIYAYGHGLDCNMLLLYSAKLLAFVLRCPCYVQLLVSWRVGFCCMVICCSNNISCPLHLFVMHHCLFSVFALALILLSHFDESLIVSHSREALQQLNAVSNQQYFHKHNKFLFLIIVKLKLKSIIVHELGFGVWICVQVWDSSYQHVQ